jgi:pyrroline-5-carboxylate reductase
MVQRGKAMRDNIAFVGGGAMGEAMIKAVLSCDLYGPQQIVVSEILQERRGELASRYGVQVTADSAQAVADADAIVLAVKPQVLPEVLSDLRAKIPPQSLILSIVAGARLATMVEGLHHAAIVRSMPNTPAQIGQGMTVWTATPDTSEEQRQQAEAILQAMGQAIHVHDEKMLDMATAVSGSGPAYVFLMMEAMIDAAVHLGFSWPVAKTLVLQTFLGSVLYASESGRHLAELRNMVTSPGGTTAEALYQLEKGGVRAAIDQAIRAAYEQSRRLAGTADPGK